MKQVTAVLLVVAGLAAGARDAAASSIVFSDAGANAAAILDTVDSFRTALGTLNPNVAGSFGSGRREINWDGVPNTQAAPNPFAPDFFNVNSPRGIVYTTPGTGFQVSGTAAAGVPIEFDNLAAGNSSLFAPFSGQRLFTAVGSFISDVHFFVPGSTNPAVTSAFGAVFSDVDAANTTSLEFFDLLGVSLGLFYVPAATGNETFSFLGVQFTDERVSRVRITSGSAADAVVMDDFVYAEPTPVPEPASLLLLGAGLAAGARRLRRRRA